MREAENKEVELFYKHSYEYSTARSYAWIPVSFYSTTENMTYLKLCRGHNVPCWSFSFIRLISYVLGESKITNLKGREAH